ncbi:MAG: hypothetical protein O2800_06395 [Planctomycetota bacterium]|nr:hypothetical protein [Planctomycetota bacterium]
MKDLNQSSAPPRHYGPLSGVFVLLGFVVVAGVLSPVHPPRIPAPGITPVADWLAETEVTRTGMRYESPRLGMDHETSDRELNSLLLLTCQEGEMPPIPLFGELGWRVSAATVAQSETPPFSILIALTSKQGHIVLISIRKDDNESATFDTFGRPHALELGAVGVLERSAPNTPDTIVFRHAGFLYAIESAHPADFESLRTAILEAPTDRIKWREL